MGDAQNIAPNRVVVLEGDSKNAYSIEDLHVRQVKTDTLVINGHGSNWFAYARGPNKDEVLKDIPPEERRTHHIEIYGSALDKEKTLTKQSTLALYEQMGRPKKIFLISCFGGAFRASIEQFDVGTTLLDMGSAKHPILASMSPIGRYFQNPPVDDTGMEVFFAEESLRNPETISIAKKVIGTDGKEHIIIIKAIAPKDVKDIETLKDDTQNREFFKKWSIGKIGDKQDIHSHFQIVADEETFKFCGMEIDAMQKRIAGVIEEKLPIMEHRAYSSSLLNLSAYRGKLDRVTELLKPAYNVTEEAKKDAISVVFISQDYEDVISQRNIATEIFNSASTEGKFQIYSSSHCKTLLPIEIQKFFLQSQEFKELLRTITPEQASKMLYDAIAEPSLMDALLAKDGINVNFQKKSPTLSHEYKSVLYSSIDVPSFVEGQAEKILKHPSVNVDLGFDFYVNGTINTGIQPGTSETLNAAASNPIAFVVGANIGKQQTTEIYLASRDNVSKLSTINEHLYDIIDESVVRSGTYTKTPLALAVEKRRYKDIDLLLIHGANVNLGLPGQTPLELAVKKGDLEVIKLLVEKHNILNKIEPRNRPTELVQAILKSETGVVAELLANISNSDLTKEYAGLTPDKIAECMGNTEIIEALKSASDKEKILSKQTSILSALDASYNVASKKIASTEFPSSSDSNPAI